MIVGMLLKNYKTYNGLKYIPVSTNSGFTSYIGDNGVGKSSVLEALDSYFNNKEWNINNKSKSRGKTGTNIPHITLVLLIEKSKLKKISADKINYEITEQISDYLWNLDKKDYKLEARKLIDDIESINEACRETHFITTAGIRYRHNNEIFFSSFDEKIAELFGFNFSILEDGSEKIKLESEFRKYFSTYNEYIKKHYSYIYIPVEVTVEDFTKLETTDIQKLMGRNIRLDITTAIGNSNLNNMNKNLNDFIKRIEIDLEKYTYKNTANRTKISMNELVDKVIELFFSIRTLHQISGGTQDIPVQELSSGEKRQAIIDISETFINTQKDYDKEIILAIDEPEASLNISKNYNQFEKLIKLSKMNTQVIITTHWYGFLPIVTNGIAHFLNLTNDAIEIDTFDLYNYREKLKQIRKKKNNSMPDDIALKSLNDLIQSILSSIKLKTPYNWLICEGSSEKIYFDYYFKDLIEKNNLRILPVGGASEVKKIYEYLELPLRDKEDNINGKIYCLIDTDSQSIEFKTNKHPNLEACRLLNKNRQTELVKTDSKEYTPPTEIEDCLNGNIFIETLKSFDDEEINEILKDEKNIKNIELNSHYCFGLRPDDKDCMKDFFDKNEGYRKIEFAKKYIELCESNDHELYWVEKIKKYFKGNK